MSKEKKLLKWQWIVFGLCWLGYASVYFGRVNLSIALPDIQQAFDFSKSQISLISSIFFWVYAIGKLINGMIGDKVSGRMFVFLGLLLAGVANILFGFTASLMAMVLIWSVNAYVQSGLWGPMSNMLTQWFSYQRKSLIAVALSTSMVAGYVLGWGLSGKISVELGWRAAFWTPGIFIAVFSLAWLLLSKNHPKEIGLKSPNLYANEDSSFPVEKLSLRQAIVKTKLWYVALAAIAQSVVKEGIAIWAPIFLMETQHLDLNQTVGFVLFIPLMNFVGILSSGYVNMLFKNNEKLTTITMLFLGMMFALGLMLFGHVNVIVAMLFLGLCSAAMFGANTIILGVLPMSFSKYGAVSSVSGFLDFCGYMATGAALATTGFFIDHWGWNGVLVFWMVISALGIISLFISHRQDSHFNEGR
ncbi:MFS transporter [Cohnella mopanensis]|uniref:MFS transporter n=1 Tax=Cohnella mopanensis TaxID=2911966 RepID=UPI001EF79B98|nr:MFS transporter [Cohnella mopanensis]